jgi:hypothetical protein
LFDFLYSIYNITINEVHIINSSFPAMLNDIFGPRRAEELSQDIGMFIEQLKILGWRDMRPWDEFFSVFKSPSWEYRSIEQRVTANFLHFRTNYLSVVAAIFVVRLIFAPALFLCIVFCAGLTVGVVAVFKDPITVGDYTLNDNAKLTACGVISFVFLGLCGALEHMLWGLIMSLFICICHMMFRPRSVSSTANLYVSEAKLATAQWSSSGSHSDGADKDDPENPVLSSGMDEQGASTTGGIYQAGLTSATMRKRN